jgi:hypothetical protein
MQARSALLAVAGLAMVATGVLATSAPEAAGIALIVIGAGLFAIGVTLPLLSSVTVSTTSFELTFRDKDDELTRLAAEISTDPAAAARLVEEALARARPDEASAVTEVVRAAESHTPTGEAPGILAELRRLPPRERAAVVLDALGEEAAGTAASIARQTRDHLAEDAARGLARLARSAL